MEYVDIVLTLYNMDKIGLNVKSMIWCINYQFRYKNTNMFGRCTVTEVEMRSAVKKFASDWKGHGDEKQETQSFLFSQVP